jgi:hypothetical protein
MQSNIDFETVTRGMRTKSDKIRALAREGAATADIARYLGIRYQHARNVLVESGLHTRRDEDGTPTAAGAQSGWIRIDSAGRLALAPEMLKAAGLAPDEAVYATAGEDGIEILSRAAALKRAEAIARRFVPEGVSLVDELIAERRREEKRDG